MGSDHDDEDAPERPSFRKFLKRVKQATTPDNLKFVSQRDPNETGTTASLGKGDSSSGGDGGDGDRTAKAQARRAQVRKAQIQHRQRKANYTKQLEMDIAKLRDDITRTEGESTALRDENNEIRKRLTKAGVAIPKPKSPALRQNLQQPPPVPPTQTQSVLMTTKEMSTRPTPFSIPGNSPDSQPSASALATSSDHYIVSLDISDSNTPAYHIYRTSSPSSGASYRSPAGNKSAAEGSSYGEGGEPNLSDRSEFTNEQTDYAINFILGLEHVCWDHFHSSFFSQAADDGAEADNGHMLMASAIALQGAPPSVFEKMGGVKECLGLNSPSQNAAGPRHQPRPSQTGSIRGQDLPPKAPVPSPISWQAPGPAAGLTLENLRQLAGALNPQDGPYAELTPVQAWFEIVRLCGPATACDDSVMDALRRGLLDVVHCVHFGAVIQRNAFDAVLERVVGGVVTTAC